MYRYLACSLGILLLIFGLSKVVAGQKNRVEKLSELNSQLNTIINRYDNYEILQGQKMNYRSLDTLFAISSKEKGLKDGNPSLRRIETRQQKIKRDLGLSFEAGYLENFRRGFFNIEELFYKSRVTMGFQWDILRGGLLDNRFQLRALKKEKQFIEARQKKERIENWYEHMRQSITYHFNDRKIELVKSSLERINSYQAVMIKLYHLDYVKWEQVLEITSQKAEIENKLNTLVELRKRILDSNQIKFPKKLPVVDVLLKPILKKGLDLSAIDSLAMFSTPNIKSTPHFLDNITLTARLEYNYYDNAAGDLATAAVQGIDKDHEFFSASLDLSVPLPLQYKADRKIAEARERMRRHKVLKAKQDKKDEITDLFNSYRQILENYINTYHDLRIQGRKIEKEEAKRDVDAESFNPTRLLKMIVRHYSLAIETLNIKQELYLELLEIHQLIGPAQISEFVTPVNPEFQLQKPRGVSLP